MDLDTLPLAGTDVYTYIWHYAVKHGKAPTAAEVTRDLALVQWEFKLLINKLRAQGRIGRHSLIPSAYGVWQRNQQYMKNDLDRNVS